MDQLTLLLQVLIAAVLGGLIGIERGGESHSPAGLRTNMIIAISSCLFTIMCLRTIEMTGGADTAMLGHIISGVGFLGAGAIFRQDSGKTGGLTTAATIWLVAGIGMTVGMGQFFLALFVTGFSLSVLHFLVPLSDWLQNADFEQHKQVKRRMGKTAKA